MDGYLVLELDSKNMWIPDARVFRQGVSLGFTGFPLSLKQPQPPKNDAQSTVNTFNMVLLKRQTKTKR
jgi:hypothetical protein